MTACIDCDSRGRKYKFSNKKIHKTVGIIINYLKVKFSEILHRFLFLSPKAKKSEKLVVVTCVKRFNKSIY